jgi:PAS domain S-box-containing protein
MTSAGEVADWNAVAEETFGWRREEALGRNMAQLIIPPRYRAAHDAGLHRYLETGEGPVLRQRIEVSALCSDGREIPVELSIAPANTPDGPVFLGFLRDISIRRQAQQLLERRARDAELMFRVTALAATSGNFDAALQECLRTICDLTGWPLGHAFAVALDEPGTLEPTQIWHPKGPDEFDRLREATHRLRFRAGVGMPGRILQHAQPEWIAETVADDTFIRADIADEVGVRAAFGFPIRSCSSR